MFAHLLKPIWKRKSRNLMLSLEILLAFVVVFAIAAAASRFYQLYQQPTGFDFASVWSVEIQASSAQGLKNDTATYDRFKRSLEALPEVEQVAFAAYAPYTNDTWTSDFYLPDSGTSKPSNIMQVSDDFFDTMHMTLQRGRWFTNADEGESEQPVVINQRYAQAMFPGQDALGKVIADHKPGDKKRKTMKVVGIFEDFRNQGEFMAPTNFVISRFGQSSDEGIGNILLRLKPGTPRGFEATLLKQLKLVRNDWSYGISPLSDMRESMLHQVEIPLIVLTVIAAFLLLMVAFGLFGVLWQNTTKRIPEIGLRRATGATSANIYRQIVTEQLLITSLAMAVGLILLAQLPITGVFGENLSWTLFLIAALASASIMALVSVLCALYPAWRASRLSPTEALQYE
jgi:putative ABC transport system permease protein